jgi:hypothetical protein
MSTTTEIQSNLGNSPLVDVKTTDKPSVEAPSSINAVDDRSSTNIETKTIAGESQSIDKKSSKIRANVEAVSSQVHIVDRTSNLDMFCYVKCEDTDSDVVKNCRGIVFDGEDMVMGSSPYTPEVSSTSEKLEGLLSSTGWRYFDSHEGALIRVFNHGDVWHTATHRKLDAFRSKWSSATSFGQNFTNAIDSCLGKTLTGFYETLNTDRQYMFLLRNTDDNRIVCNAPENPTVYHVGTFIDHVINIDDDVGLPHPKEYTFSNIDALRCHVNSTYYGDLQGIMCFNTNGPVQVKVLNDDYITLASARNNEPSVPFRYLQVRMDRRVVNTLYNLYPKHADVFDEYENLLYAVAKDVIYRSYVNRFIRHQYVTVPVEEFKVIREAHDWHKADRPNNKISLEKIVEIMNTQPATSLNRMVRRARTEKIVNVNHRVSRPRSTSVCSNKSYTKSPATFNTSSGKHVSLVNLPPPAFSHREDAIERSTSLYKKALLYRPKTQVRVCSPCKSICDVPSTAKDTASD